jgi:enterobactin synthetase component D
VAADIAFDLALEHGRCIGVRIPERDADVDALAGALAPAERARAMALPGPRRRTWTGGRTAMREALDRLAQPLEAVAFDDRGAPVLPAGVAGSITHKERLAAALVAFETRARLGVDVELDVARPLDIASRVLRDAEVDELDGLGPAERAGEVLLRFSAKEAIYKALDPFVRRYVEFKEMSVSPRPDGTAVVTPYLREDLRAREGSFVIEVRWRRFDGIVLTTARVERVAVPNV